MAIGKMTRRFVNVFSFSFCAEIVFGSLMFYTLLHSERKGKGKKKEGGGRERVGVGVSVSEECEFQFLTLLMRIASYSSALVA